MFLQEIRNVLQSSHRHASWYPGSSTNYEKFQNNFPDCTVEEYGIDSETDDLPPWMLVTGLCADKADISTENWCGVVQVHKQCMLSIRKTKQSRIQLPFCAKGSCILFAPLIAC